jgi:hypothetical protein
MFIQVVVQSLLKKLKSQPRQLPFPEEKKSGESRKDLSGFILALFFVFTVVLLILFSNM